MLGGTRAPEQLRAPPRGLLPAAAAPRPLPRCAAPGAGTESPLQLQGRPGWVTPPPPAPLPDPAGRMEPPEGAGPGGECGPKCPGVPELRLSPQPDAAPFPPARSSAAPGGRTRPRWLRVEPGRSRRKPGLALGEARPGAAPGNGPRFRRGAHTSRPRPLVLCAFSPDSRQARSWVVGPEFRAEPQTSRAGVPGVWAWGVSGP